MNPAHTTNWLPGLLVLGAGIAVALAYLLGNRRLRAEAPTAETADDLEARYQRLLGELKEHAANKHLLSADVWQAEQARLERAAADVLRERDSKRHEDLKAQARAEKRAAEQAKDTSFLGRNPGLTGALVGGGVVAFFAFLGFQLSQSATERVEGGSITGGGPSAPMQAPPTDTKLDGLSARVRANPDDSDAVADLAVYLIRRQAFDDARPLIERAMLLDPYHPKARVGRAVMRAFQGEVAAAMDDLERLAARYPEAYDGHMFAGMLALDSNDTRRAVTAFENFLASAPLADQPPMIRMALQQLRAELDAAPR
jgi:tetratricopeptide (TPR) repeat protein